MTTDIKKIIASVQRLHGDERTINAKRESYVTWLLREREKAFGGNPPVIKAEETR